jgi:hypothetical protein
MNILIKLTSIVALIIAPHLPKVPPLAHNAGQNPATELVTEMTTPVSDAK